MSQTAHAIRHDSQEPSVSHKRLLARVRESEGVLLLGACPDMLGISGGKSHYVPPILIRNSVRPARIRSPSSTRCSATSRAPLRRVPLVVPKSRTSIYFPDEISSQCRADISVSSGNETSHPLSRPITDLSTRLTW